jgi:hypothetical protein
MTELSKVPTVPKPGKMLLWLRIWLNCSFNLNTMQQNFWVKCYWDVEKLFWGSIIQYCFILWLQISISKWFSLINLLWLQLTTLISWLLTSQLLIYVNLFCLVSYGSMSVLCCTSNIYVFNIMVKLMMKKGKKICVSTFRIQDSIVLAFISCLDA